MATSFPGVCFIGVKPQVATPVNFLKVVQGGYSTILGTEFGNNDNESHKYAKSWDIDPVFGPVGPGACGRIASAGHWYYDGRSDQFELIDSQPCQIRYVRIGNSVGHICYQAAVPGRTRYHRTDAGYYGGVAQYCRDYATFGNSVILTDASNAVIAWAYPFTSPPTTVQSLKLQRLCVRDGKFYGLSVGNHVDFSIYEYNGSIFTQKVNIVPTDAGNLIGDTQVSTQQAFFSYGDYLWVVLGYDALGTNLVRCYRVDPSDWSNTEMTGLIPDGTGGRPDWTVAGATGNRIAEIEYQDADGNTEFLILRGNQTSGGWEVVNFDESTMWTLVAQGSEILNTFGGGICKENGGVCFVEEMTDHQDYVEIRHGCSHLGNISPNPAIDVDINYNFQDNPSPGGTTAPELSGPPSEGKTNLSTAPTPAPNQHSDLDDDFSGAFDPEKFEPVNLYFDPIGASYGWYGVGATANVSGLRYWWPYSQSGGGIHFSATSPAPIPYAQTGMGVMLRWQLGGDFNWTMTLDRLTSLLGQASAYYWMYMIAVQGSNNGVGICVRSVSGVNYLPVGILLRPDTTPVINTGANVLINGDKLRITRTGGVWACSSDVDTPDEEVVTPAGIPGDITGDVTLYFGAFTRSSNNWTNTTPGPGFSNMAFSEVGGNVGAYLGPVSHIFNMDLSFVPNVNKAMNILTRYKEDYVP